MGFDEQSHHKSHIFRLRLIRLVAGGIEGGKYEGRER